MYLEIQISNSSLKRKEVKHATKQYQIVKITNNFLKNDHALFEK